MDTCHVKNEELEPKLQKCNGRVVLRGGIVEDDSGAHAVFNWTLLFCFPNCFRTSNVCFFKITILWRTSSWCSIRVRASKIWGQFPKSQCADVWIRLPRQMTRVMRNHWRSLGNYWTNFFLVIHLLDYYGFEEALFELDGTKVPSLECMFFNRKQGFFLSVYVDAIKKWLERNRSRISVGAPDKSPGWETPYTRTVAMHWAILWTGKQESGAALPSLKSLFGWSPIQKKRNSLIQSETCQKFAHKLSQSSSLWTNSFLSFLNHLSPPLRSPSPCYPFFLKLHNADVFIQYQKCDGS